MAKITKDGRYIIHVPYRGHVKIQSFSGLAAVSDYIASKRGKLGDHHPYITAAVAEFGRLASLMNDRGISPAADIVIPLYASITPMMRERPIVPGKLEAHRGNVTVTGIMPRAGEQYLDKYHDKKLDDDARSAAIRHVSRLQTDEYYRACVAEAEAEAAAPFNAAATPAPEPTEWGPHLPAHAPRLWIDRDKETETDPADFIRQVYGEWLPHLSKRDLLYLDRSLYFAYAKWLGGDGKDAPPVEFGGNPRGRLDDATYGAAMRQKNQTGIAKLRAAKRDRGRLTHSP